MLKILLISNCRKWNFVLVMSYENAFILQNNNNNKNSFSQQQKKFPFSTVIGKKNPNTRPKCMHCPTHRHKNLCIFYSKFEQSITFIWNSHTHWSQPSPLIVNTQQKAKFTKTQSRKMTNHTFNSEFVMSLQKLAMSL